MCFRSERSPNSEFNVDETPKSTIVNVKFKNHIVRVYYFVVFLCSQDSSNTIVQKL